MWIKNIEVKNVEHLGFDNRKHEGNHALVKRVTIECDVVMLPVHNNYSDPIEAVQDKMDSQIWYLRDPVIHAVYKKDLSKIKERPPLPDEEIKD